MLTTQAIALNIECNNAVDAITESGRLLKESGLCNEGYIAAMVDNYHINGSYFVIAPKLALPHARPESGAIASGISVLTLKKPVIFGHEDNDPVSLVIGISATSSDQHVDVIRRIVTVLNNSSDFEALLTAKSPNEVLSIFSSD